MCGIAGFFDPDHRIDPAQYEGIARAMAARLVHRGPDAEGSWCDAAAGIALGFRRLAILDLSPAGHQPMLSADGRYVLTFNGEIYNHRELRRDLSGIAWRGHSDSEALIEGIARWGFRETLTRANGMFAIAAWDRRERRLHLARDRFGEKPLYCGWIDGVLLFASELKALAAHPLWTGALDRPAIGAYLRYGFVPAPSSAFAGVRKLTAGCTAEISASRRETDATPYWSAPERAAAAAAQPFAGSFDAAAEQFQTLLDDAVAIRLEADVALGAFLSGGIDSSSVVAAMQKARPGTKSFCVGFPDAGFDEAPHAAAVARKLGTEHETLRVSERECLEFLPQAAAAYDEPFADPSAVPTLILSHLTREHVTVALSGDGGDELFGGYARYARAAAEWQQLAARPAWARSVAGAAARALAGAELRPVRRLRRIFGNAAHASPEALYRNHLASTRPEDGLAPTAGEAASLLDAPLDEGLPSLPQQFMLRDTITYLPDDLLVKIDRASMAFALEVRAPFLDPRIAEFAWSLPEDFVAEKRLPRAALYARVPRALVDRPKHGFEPPLARWLAQGLRGWADERLDPARLERHGFVAPPIISARWRAHREGRRNWARVLWPVLVLEDWLERQNAHSSPPLSSAVASP
ncbi:MAG TPA: asparagine synthase (glutamine-hydrolyzing) [Stellaceae bacterium]|nr:asparagine synthase (glutamine-hydrolyzing) [Stellaceae bacterium]